MGKTTTGIEQIEKIMLKIISDKMLTLNNVLNVTTIRKNLVSASVVFKCALTSDKVVISKNKMFFRKG